MCHVQQFYQEQTRRVRKANGGQIKMPVSDNLLQKIKTHAIHGFNLPHVITIVEPSIGRVVLSSCLNTIRPIGDYELLSSDPEGAMAVLLANYIVIS